MVKREIQHDRPNCIGCAACAAIDSKNWLMKDDGKSDLIESKNIKGVFVRSVEIVDIEEIKRASSNCPVNIIKIA